MRTTIITLFACCTLTMSAQQTLPYQNPKLKAEVRADDLLGRLTLDEKVRLMI